MTGREQASPVAPAAANGPFDPGLQAERTGLAWTRTALAMAANAALVLRAGLTTHSNHIVAAGIGLATVTAVVGAIGWRRHHRIVQALAAGRHPLAPLSLGITVGATLIAGIAALATVAF